MPSDLDIARAAKMEPIEAVAWKLGISSHELTPMGNGVAKITWDALKERFNKPSGSLVLVTSVNPTPFGEGKTVTTIGLTQAYAPSVNRRLALFGNLPWVRFSVSKAVLQAAVGPKSCPWRTSTST